MTGIHINYQNGRCASLTSGNAICNEVKALKMLEFLPSFIVFKERTFRDINKLLNCRLKYYIYLSGIMPYKGFYNKNELHYFLLFLVLGTSITCACICTRW